MSKRAKPESEIPIEVLELAEYYLDAVEEFGDAVEKFEDAAEEFGDELLLQVVKEALLARDTTFEDEVDREPYEVLKQLQTRVDRKVTQGLLYAQGRGEDRGTTREEMVAKLTQLRERVIGAAEQAKAFGWTEDAFLAVARESFRRELA